MILLKGNRNHDPTEEDPNRKSPPSMLLQEEGDGDELGLSLRVSSSSSKVEGDEERNNKERLSEETRGFRPALQGGQPVHSNNNLGGGIMSNMITSPPNKRARVSVRARCEAATVSS